MLTDWFWDVATSTFFLSFDGVVLAAALAVGFLPLLKWVPVIGSYVPAARLVAAIVAALLCFLIGFRISDERENVKNLRATVAIQKADLDNALKSAADETLRAGVIEKAANDQRKTDDAYIAAIELNPACGFEPFPGRVRDKSAAGPGNAGPATAPDGGQDSKGAPGALARSKLPFPMVFPAWLRGKRPERDAPTNGE